MRAPRGGNAPGSREVCAAPATPRSAHLIKVIASVPTRRRVIRERSLARVVADRLLGHPELLRQFLGTEIPAHDHSLLGRLPVQPLPPQRLGCFRRSGWSRRLTLSSIRFGADPSDANNLLLSKAMTMDTTYTEDTEAATPILEMSQGEYHAFLGARFAPASACRSTSSFARSTLVRSTGTIRKRSRWPG